MPTQPKLTRFNQNVLSKYQIYNGIHYKEKPIKLRYKQNDLKKLKAITTYYNNAYFYNSLFG
jgi:hypothetical protein